MDYVTCAGDSQRYPLPCQTFLSRDLRSVSVQILAPDLINLISHSEFIPTLISYDAKTGPLPGYRPEDLLSELRYLNLTSLSLVHCNSPPCSALKKDRLAVAKVRLRDFLEAYRFANGSLSKLGISSCLMDELGSQDLAPKVILRPCVPQDNGNKHSNSNLGYLENWTPNQEDIHDDGDHSNSSNYSSNK